LNLGDESRAIGGDPFGGDDVREAAVDPTADRRLRNLEFRKEIAISRLENRLPDPVIVGPP
jgi:hypothetical protein